MNNVQNKTGLIQHHGGDEFLFDSFSKDQTIFFASAKAMGSNIAIKRVSKTSYDYLEHILSGPSKGSMATKSTGFGRIADVYSDVSGALRSILNYIQETSDMSEIDKTLISRDMKPSPSSFVPIDELRADVVMSKIAVQSSISIVEVIVKNNPDGKDLPPIFIRSNGYEFFVVEEEGFYFQAIVETDGSEKNDGIVKDVESVVFETSFIPNADILWNIAANKEGRIKDNKKANIVGRISAENARFFSFRYIV